MGPPLRIGISIGLNKLPKNLASLFFNKSNWKEDPMQDTLDTLGVRDLGFRKVSDREKSWGPIQLEKILTKILMKILTKVKFEKETCANYIFLNFFIVTF